MSHDDCMRPGMFLSGSHPKKFAAERCGRRSYRIVGLQRNCECYWERMLDVGFLNLSAAARQCLDMRRLALVVEIAVYHDHSVLFIDDEVLALALAEFVNEGF
ncbi:hypothetical protein C8R48DRAFT_679225 [Suillus tomentosus]|nr:hypothetical protein C8R48DRAFT_679225 [Suillus tomentosus]